MTSAAHGERTAERRRAPRRPAEDALISMSAAVGVRVLDISISGILIESPNRVDPGSRGRLRMSLDGTPVSFDVQIERVAPESGPTAGYRIGARFLDLDVTRRHLIERFVMR